MLSQTDILKQRLERLKKFRPANKAERKLLKEDIEKIERELKGLKPKGRKKGSKNKPKPPVNKTIDWKKVAIAASKL